MNYIDDNTILEILKQENLNYNEENIFRSPNSNIVFILIDYKTNEFMRIIPDKNNEYKVRFNKFNDEIDYVAKLNKNHESVSNNYFINDDKIKYLLDQVGLNDIIENDNHAIFRSKRNNCVICVYMYGIVIINLTWDNLHYNIGYYNMNGFYKKSQYRKENNKLIRENAIIYK